MIEKHKQLPFQLKSNTMKNHTEEKSVNIMASALEQAFKSVGCDLRCFDWLSYRPDYWIKKEEEKN